ncbi:MAG: tetratricopeptide repeat protein, partial [Myxococcota bacterium]
MEAARKFIEAFRAGRYQAARTVFEGLQGGEREHPLVLEVAANVYGQLGERDLEVDHWRTLSRIRPTDARICRSLATALLDQERLEEASKELRRFLFGQQPDVEVAGLLAQVLLRRRKYADSIEVVEEIRSVAEADDRAALTALEARARFHLDQITAARALLKALDEAPPGSAIACREIGQTWRTMHDFPRAIAWFTRAGALEPRDVDTWETLASCHEQNREPTKARQIADATRMRFGLTAGIERLLVRLDHHDEHLEEARRRGERLLAEPLLPSMRRSLQLELAAVAQRQGDLAATWEHAQAGNRLAG